MSFPPSSATVNVRIIDTTTYMKCPASMFVDTRPYPDLEVLEFPSYAFLIEHHDKVRVSRYLFDLGLRKDWRNGFPPAVRTLEKIVATYGYDAIEVRREVRQILEENEIRAEDIDGIIWRLAAYHTIFFRTRGRTVDPSYFFFFSQWLTGAHSQPFSS